MRIALVGATGMVGQEMLKVLAERSFPITELIMVASSKSKGKVLEFGGHKHILRDLEEALSLKPELALFSAGGATAKEWAPKFASQGCYVVDNSSAFRMDSDKKLIVPEINGESLTPEDKIIPNPNCSTIQLVMALEPLHKLYGLKRVVVSTYQSISGTGKGAVDQMLNERAGKTGAMVYPYPIDQNCLPHCDVFEEDGYTKEELKVENETRKILGIENLSITCTAVRVPVQGGHSESVNVEFEREPVLSEVFQALQGFPGIKVQDNPDVNTYPMPLFARGKDEVFVGRIRKDRSHKNTLNMWIVADNLRKGAATNTVQIAELIATKVLAPSKA